MISIFSLWLPILLSAVFVFVVSSVIHTVLTYHRSDFKKVPNEQEVMDELRKFEIPPGDYYFPRAETSQEMKSEEFKQKVEKGPVAFFTMLPNEVPSMGKSLILWFIYCLIVSVFSAYIAGRALEPGSYYLSVFRFAGATAFAGYSLALIQQSIWYHKPWSATFKSMFDGLVYALVTAGTFGWLWP